ncbi:amino acid ABC transporter permease [Rhodococcus jostii]|uniref:Amino acid ABC transporter membrane protein, PAAT family n=1 Tax=Rhodococcus jostii TaxID=132919 RepID=A0A1H5DKY0_RHOJO|nr:amino acid ABC transporter permease [Rhodococcus jostii]SED79502.1 amino acid ABC transporter membrane protein, PAAT family [Rhodococcus jostii]
MTTFLPKPASTQHTPEHADVSEARPRLRPMRWVISAVLLVLAAQLAYFVVNNDRFGWDIVWGYLFYPTVLKGLAMSVFITVIGMAVGSLLGVALAAGQSSDFLPVRLVCQMYVGVFRGIPPLVQLIFWFNLAYLLPDISIGIPFGPTFGSWSSTELISPLTAALIGLSLHEAAYMSEIIRSGLGAVDAGQRDAALAMGFTKWRTFSRVILPQAMRIIVPPTGNQFISLLKGTSLVSVIAMTDLLFSVQLIYNRTYQVVPLLIVACIWYLVVVSLLTVVQRRLERRYGKGQRREEVPKINWRSGLTRRRISR